MENKTLQAVLSAALAAFTVYFNALAVPLIVLLVMMAIDYITGVTAAGVDKKVSSRIGIIGIVKKVGYVALVAVAMCVDYLIYSGFEAVHIQISCDMWFGLLVTIWLIINEIISILENLSRIGVPMPAFLIKVVQKLKITVDKESEE